MFSSVPGKYFLLVFLDTSFVSFVSQYTNLCITSEDFGCWIRSVCFIPHFLTTERKQAHSGYNVACERRCFSAVVLPTTKKGLFVVGETQAWKAVCSYRYYKAIKI